MLSLQSVQAEQVLPQVQGQPLSAYAEPKRSEKTDVSFLDLLRAEKTVDAPEQTPVSRMNDEQPRSQNAEPIAEKREAEPVREKLPQDETVRVSQKENEPPEEIAQDAVDAELVALLGLEPPLMVEENAVPVVYQPDTNTVLDVASAETLPPQHTIGIALNNLAWLYAKNPDAEAVPDEAVTQLLDETAFLVPDIAVDGDDLAEAQSFVVENPAAFLQDAESLAAKIDDEAETVAPDGKKNVAREQKNKPRLEITDMRTQKTETAAETENAVTKAQNKNGADFAFAQKDEPSVQVTMDMMGSVEQNITSANTQTAAANGSNFQSMLTNAIQENAPEFVKAGNIVLRDGNQGAINLILRPESLGNVKISLSLSDKVITGQITVQSQEAYNAFKDSIDSLKAAFAQSGFEAQGFDLNFAGNQQFAQRQQNEWQNPEFAIRAGQTYGDFVTGETESDGAAYAYADYGINIVA